MVFKTLFCVRFVLICIVPGAYYLHGECRAREAYGSEKKEQIVVLKIRRMFFFWTGVWLQYFGLRFRARDVQHHMESVW